MSTTFFAARQNQGAWGGNYSARLFPSLQGAGTIVAGLVPRAPGEDRKQLPSARLSRDDRINPNDREILHAALP
jgi:hypothetical protein